MTMRWTLIVAAVALLSTAARPALGGSEDGALLYTQWAGFNSDIMRATPGGGDVTNLTEHPLFDHWPAWSPDGQRIAFSSRRDGDSRLYVMDADAAAYVASMTKTRTAERRRGRGTARGLQSSWSGMGQRRCTQCESRTGLSS